MAGRAAIGRKAGVIRRERLDLVRAVARRAVLVRIALDGVRDRRRCAAAADVAPACGVPPPASLHGWLMAGRAAIGRETGMIRRERLDLVRAVARRAVLVRIAVDGVRDRRRCAGGRGRCAGLRRALPARGRLMAGRAATRSGNWRDSPGTA